MPASHHTTLNCWLFAPFPSCGDMQQGGGGIVGGLSLPIFYYFINLF